MEISDHSVYLYKPPETENFVNSWVYYRVDSVRGPNEPAGTLGAPVQMCRLSWPSFADILPMVDTPGVTGLTSAYRQMCSIAKNQWGVDHEQSILIGMLEYDTKTGRLILAGSATDAPESGPTDPSLGPS